MNWGGRRLDGSDGRRPGHPHCLESSAQAHSFLAARSRGVRDQRDGGEKTSRDSDEYSIHALSVPTVDDEPDVQSLFSFRAFPRCKVARRERVPDVQGCTSGTRSLHASPPLSATSSPPSPSPTLRTCVHTDVRTAIIATIVTYVSSLRHHRYHHRHHHHRRHHHHHHHHCCFHSSTACGTGRPRRAAKDLPGPAARRRARKDRRAIQAGEIAPCAISPACIAQCDPI